MKDKKITLFDLHTPTRSVKERIQATSRLKKEAVELRSINTLELSRRISAFYKAGWTISDILYALENHPTAGAYTTYGAGGMRSAAAWLHTRLNAAAEKHGGELNVLDYLADSLDTE